MARRMTVFERDLRRAFSPHVTPDDIDLALRVIRGEENATEVMDRVATQPFQRWYTLTGHMAVLYCLDILLGTHGVEALGGDANSHKPAPWYYLNVGDAYTVTVVWYRSSGRYYVRSYGSIVEAYRVK